MQNQDDSVASNLVVTAYDKAGNKTVAVYEAPASTVLGIPLYFLMVLGAILVFIVWILFRRIKRNKKNVQISQRV